MRRKRLWHDTNRYALVALMLAAAIPAAHGQRPTPPLPSRGVEISAIPAINFDADEGFGYGAIVALADYGEGALPYRYTLQPTAFLTTKGRRDFTIYLDAPALLPRQWRLTAFAGREQQLATPYYGTGNTSFYDQQLEKNGSPYYYRFGRDRIRASLDLQHALGNRAARLLLGAGASREVIDLAPFDSGTTLIAAQLGGATPPHGHLNYLRAGLIWDTRDQEIGPHDGTWADIIVQRVSKSLGASAEYTRYTATYRRYQPLGARLTFAQRLLAQDVRGDAPFYDLAAVQTEFKPQDGLGGSSTVRGLPKDRYMGRGIAISNSELRWLAREFSLYGRASTLVLSSFVDAGRVWPGDIRVNGASDNLHVGFGGGARVGFGKSFVVALDVAHSSQATAPFYVGLGYLF